VLRGSSSVLFVAMQDAARGVYLISTTKSGPRREDGTTWRTRGSQECGCEMEARVTHLYVRWSSGPTGDRRVRQVPSARGFRARFASQTPIARGLGGRFEPQTTKRAETGSRSRIDHETRWLRRDSITRFGRNSRERRKGEWGHASTYEARSVHEGIYARNGHGVCTGLSLRARP
jgi:hypothetical protein